MTFSVAVLPLHVTRCDTPDAFWNCRGARHTWCYVERVTVRVLGLYLAAYSASRWRLTSPLNRLVHPLLAAEMHHLQKLSVQMAVAAGSVQSSFLAHFQARPGSLLIEVDLANVDVSSPSPAGNMHSISLAQVFYIGTVALRPLPSTENWALHALLNMATPESLRPDDDLGVIGTTIPLLRYSGRPFRRIFAAHSPPLPACFL